MSDTALQQSLFDEETKIERVERDKRIHKTAFRVAFDFLEQHWPPEYTEEYWVKTCNDVSAVSGENILNPLCQELLGAVLCYMSDVSKERKDG